MIRDIIDIVAFATVMIIITITIFKLWSTIL